MVDLKGILMFGKPKFKAVLALLLCGSLAGCTIIYKSKNISVQQATVLLGGGEDDRKFSGSETGNGGNGHGL